MSMNFSKTIYLDHAATTPLHPEVLEAMKPFMMGYFGNPSSLYRLGQDAGKALQCARETIASALQIQKSDHLVFTSGGTESDNLAIKGIAFGLKHKGQHIITSAIEHPAVLESCRWLAQQGWKVTYLPVTSEGFVQPKSLEAALRSDTVLVSIMHGNNEIGSLQPLEQLAEMTHTHGALFHSDAVQTVGKLSLNLSTLPLDLLSASAHKFYGPKGVGFLYLTEQARAVLTPWLHGGGQQNSVRSGTENVPGVIGMAKALELSCIRQTETLIQMREQQTYLIEGIQAQIPGAILNGPSDLSKRVPGNVNFSFPPLEGDTLVIRLDREGIAVSSGSACHSAQLQASYVIQAIGGNEARARSSLRFSLGNQNTRENMTTVVATLSHLLSRIPQARTLLKSPP